MAVITPVSATISGTNPGGIAASAGGDLITNTKGNAVARVTNGGGASINVTLGVTGTPTREEGQGFPAIPLQPQVVPVPAGQARYIQLYPAFNNGSAQVPLTYSAVTSVTVEALQP